MKLKRLPTALPLVLLLLGKAVPASASVIVTNPATAPTSGLVLQHIPTDAGSGSISYSWNNQYELGQSFYATQRLAVTAITLPFAVTQPGAATKTFTLSIYQTNSASEAPSAGNLIAEDTGTFPGSLTNNTFLRFELAGPVNLDKDKYYIFMLRSHDLNTSVNFVIANTNAAGQNSFTWYKDTGAYGRYTTRGLTMYIEGTAIPEVSAMGLLIPFMGVGFLLSKHLKGTK